MLTDTLALIQAKILETEDKLAKLRITESELSTLAGRTAKTAMTQAKKRGRPARVVSAPEVTETPKTSVLSQIRAYLATNGSSTAPALAEAIGVETRPISFALQALKRKGEAKSIGRDWSLPGRRKKAI